MDTHNPIADSEKVTKGAAKKRFERFVINIRQGTSKREILNLLKEHQFKNYRVTDVKVFTLRPLHNSLPYVLDIAFAKSDNGISSSIIKLPFLRPLATSTPKRLTERLSLDLSESLSAIDASNSNFGFDLSYFSLSPEDILRDTRFEDLNYTFNFSLGEFQPPKFFGATQSTPTVE
jgi:hypothetical protein